MSQQQIEQIEQIVKHLNEDFPTAEFSFGYLFNHPCPVDEQQWYLFTQIPVSDDRWRTHQARHRFAFSGAGHTDKLLAELTGDRFFAWMNRISGDMDTDRHRFWLQKIHLNDCPECGSRSWATGSRMKYGVYVDVCHCLQCDHRYDKKAA